MMDESDDDKPLAQLQKEKEGDADSDNDLTLADMLKKIKSDRATKKKKVPKKKGAAMPEAASKRTKTSNSATSTAGLPSGALEKQAIVEGILRRWTYCLPDWPDTSQIGGPPKGFVECGFPGLYIGVENDTLGEVIDRRDKENGCPPIQSTLLKLPTKELQSYLRYGIEKQIAHLEENKADHATSVYRETRAALLKESKQARAYNATKIDKEYKKSVNFVK
uniref:Uncharacterized protein n=1 Tax=Mucochytrium quahogii TaxID=96639 RepID=A0A7S2SQF0_9STRA|mmetsp:Transcript_9934/g.16260  ORF Transcript_9934/g.16260 Transcript_9934/m.16260 type:complete len:221 (-) Transcript_9934:364-1026(-)|eukprot:CAMPEP_0203743806 /NCGR_PEP_ID=MMETSP0098-20131031/90_1 /ASSEMBLY_ACC=CAM_ASM_000208 /TAXON_ID=96639 /ORGANISM=" , Strain NY0313808BC1" /LENGTH=220 /DNA_ID=CAMNT_0050631141 /DNA_START=455 /DNA_END=1114 /DNA_ORIENTATION=+